MVKVADVTIDNDLNKRGEKARKTEIKFVTTIDKEAWKKRTNWCYVLVIDSNVEKIGGTAAGLKDRCQSYLCGTEEYRHKGTCATTNYICYQAMLHALNSGSTVEMYAAEIPPVEVVVEAIGQKFVTKAPVYHQVESFLLDEYKEEFGAYPSLSQKAGKS